MRHIPGIFLFSFHQQRILSQLSTYLPGLDRADTGEQIHPRRRAWNQVEQQIHRISITTAKGERVALNMFLLSRLK